jgi:hypothetical protein
MAYSTVDTTVGGYAVRILVPSGWSNGGKCVIYHHGAGETAASLTTDTRKTDVVNRITDDGYLMASSTAAGNNWGNQAGLDAYAALEAYIATNYAPTATAIFSQSMGGCTGLLTASQGGYAGWFGIYPVCSLADMFDGNAGSFAADIRTAYGIAANGSDYSTKTAGFDPALLSSSLFDRLPMRFWASAGDTVVNKAANTDAMRAVVAGSMAESDLTVCTGDHGDASHFVPQEVSDFLARCFVARTMSHRSV